MYRISGITGESNVWRFAKILLLENSNRLEIRMCKAIIDTSKYKPYKCNISLHMYVGTNHPQLKCSTRVTRVA